MIILPGEDDHPSVNLPRGSLLGGGESLSWAEERVSLGLGRESLLGGGERPQIGHKPYVFDTF